MIRWVWLIEVIRMWLINVIRIVAVTCYEIISLKVGGSMMQIQTMLKLFERQYFRCVCFEEILNLCKIIISITKGNKNVVYIKNLRPYMNELFSLLNGSQAQNQQAITAYDKLIRGINIMMSIAFILPDMEQWVTCVLLS